MSSARAFQGVPIVPDRVEVPIKPSEGTVRQILFVPPDEAPYLRINPHTLANQASSGFILGASGGIRIASAWNESILDSQFEPRSPDMEVPSHSPEGSGEMVTAEAAQFIESQGLADHFEQMKRIVRERFRVVGKLAVSLDNDPEDSFGPSVVIKAQVAGDPNTVADAEWAFAVEAAQSPGEGLDRFRLICDIK